MTSNFRIAPWEYDEVVVCIRGGGMLPGTFNRKQAEVIVGWLNRWSASGLDTIAKCIAGASIDPPKEEEEK